MRRKRKQRRRGRIARSLLRKAQVGSEGCLGGMRYQFCCELSRKPMGGVDREHFDCGVRNGASVPLMVR